MDYNRPVLSHWAFPYGHVRTMVVATLLSYAAGRQGGGVRGEQWLFVVAQAMLCKHKIASVKSRQKTTSVNR